ncbi:MAG TPA: acylase [Flavisolibacter sp.]
MSIAFASRHVMFVLFIACHACTATAQKGRAEILWDQYGIPHIYASSVENMYYAFGWTQMHNHADLVLKLYGEARGRASEYWGKQYVNTDRKILLFDMPGRAQVAYDHQDREYKTYFDAFVAGMNAYAKKYPDAISASYKQVLPVTVYDVIAHSMRVPLLEFLGARDIALAFQQGDAGSNAVAIAPSRSASKNPLLLANPHTPWSDLFTWFEAHLNAPGINAYGATLVGVPTPGIAFNEFLGWTHTNNTIDASDRYKLLIKDGGYVLDGRVEPFTTRTVTLKIKQDDGTLQEQPLLLRYSRHGPVVAHKNDTAYAVRIAGMQNDFIFKQYVQMIRARNLQQFEDALRMLQNPFFNVIYADKDGNIMYLFNGNVPVRPEGNWSFWRGVVTGTESKFIWDSTHRYADLPRVINPATGFVQNANDPPWSSTFPPMLDPRKFPSYMSPVEPDFRAQRSIKMFSTDTSITFDELVQYKMNTGIELADRLLPDLLQAAAASQDPLVQQAIPVLKAWDRRTDTASRGAVLFMEWLMRNNISMFATRWQLTDPLGTPKGIRDPEAAVKELGAAARSVLDKYGALDISWGQVNRFRGGAYDLPANGGVGEYGIYRVIRFRPDADKKNRAISGDSYVSVVEFGKKIRAEALLSYGNASQPGSPHVGDQLRLLSQGKLRPVLFYKPDVLKKAKKRETL